MDIPALSGATAPSNPSKPTALGQEDFLALMVAQFQNQDPFKPMENGDFLGQMAQFSTVSGLDELNAKFESLAQALGGEQAIGAANLIGRQALFNSSITVLDETGQTVDGAIETGASAQVMIDVNDASGQLIRSLALNASGPGTHRFSWDGRDERGRLAPAGQYAFQARSGAGDGQVELPVLLAGQIEGVSVGGARGASLNVAGLGSQNLSAVRELY